MARWSRLCPHGSFCCVSPGGSNFKATVSLNRNIPAALRRHDARLARQSTPPCLRPALVPGGYSCEIAHDVVDALVVLSYCTESTGGAGYSGGLARVCYGEKRAGACVPDHEKAQGGALALSALLVSCVGAAVTAPAIALAAEMRADTGVFTVTGGILGTDYAYSEPNGVDVLTVKTSTELTISTNNATESPANGRIVIESDVTANITLAGVNITPADSGTDDGYSGIDLSSGATLNLTLSDDSTNEICGGTSSTGLPGPGIHVPEGSTLTISGNGSLEVGGASGSNAAAVGIGGKASESTAGEACGNVFF